MSAAARAVATVAVMATILLFAGAATAWTHVARAGETLDVLATLYYGSARFSMIIRAANGFMHPDDGRLLQGERVEIPEVIYHEASDGETWDDLAQRHLGAPERGRYLAEMNGAEAGEALVTGRIVKIPYQLLYVLAPDESIRTVAKTYLDERFSVQWLQAYNFRKKKKWKRGDALLVPLTNVEFTAEQKRLVDEARKEGQPTGEDRQAQVDAVERIAAMRDAFVTGRYVEVVAVGQHLLGAAVLTSPQKIGVYQYLAFAHVAFGQREEALEAFGLALEIQPEMELSPITTSPKILEVFREAQGRRGPRGPRKGDR